MATINHGLVHSLGPGCSSFRRGMPPRTASLASTSAAVRTIVSLLFLVAATGLPSEILVNLHISHQEYQLTTWLITKVRPAASHHLGHINCPERRP